MILSVLYMSLLMTYIASVKEGRRTMDFLIQKFSDWLRSSNIHHSLIRVKGGYIIKIDDQHEDLKKLISSLLVMINTGETDPTTGLGISKPVNVFTKSGDIIFEYKYTAEIINTVQPAIADFIRNKVRG